VVTFGGALADIFQQFDAAERFVAQTADSSLFVSQQAGKIIRANNGMDH